MKFSGLGQTIFVAAALLLSNCGAQNDITQLSADEFHAMSTGGDFDLVIDVRTVSEWRIGHIENATFVENLQVQLAETDDYQATLTSLNLWGCRYCRVAVYCRSGSRARQALNLLIEAGFEGPLYNGLGVSQWTAQGYELVNDPSKDDRPCMTVDNPVLVSRDQRGVCTGEAPPELVDVTGTTQPESTDVSESYYEMVQMELDTNKDLFVSQMSAHNTSTYSFLFTRTCFCLPAGYPWRVTAQMQQLMMGVKPNLTQEMSPAMLMSPVQSVMGDAVQSAVTDTGNDILAMESTSATIYSIMDLFGKIQEAIDMKADSISVVYNREWGFPEDIFIDYNTMVADEEFVASVSDFTLVEWEVEDYEMMDTNTSQIGFDEGE